MIPRPLRLSLLLALPLLSYGLVDSEEERISSQTDSVSLPNLIVAQYSQNGFGKATFRLEGEIDTSTENRSLTVSARGIGSNDFIPVVRAPQIPGESTSRHFFLEGDSETPYGFYRLILSNGKAEKLLGTIHWRHGGHSIQFISPEESNHAYPPEIAVWTEKDKAEQKEKTWDLIQAIGRDLEAGKKEIQIPPGDYRVDASMVASTPDNEALFLLENHDGLQIDGGGSTFWITDPGIVLFRVTRSEDLTLRNFTVDYDPLPYVQGRVTEIRTGASPFIRFELSPGFEDAWKLYASKPVKGLGRIHIFSNDESNGLPLSPQWIAGADDGRNNPERANEVRSYDPTTRIATVNLVVPQNARDLPGYGIEIGDLIAVTPRYGGLAPIELRDTGNTEIEDVTVYASGKQGFYIRRATGKVNLLRYRLMRRPNTRRLISSNMDGMMLRYCRVGPELIDCEFEAAMDDSIAITAFNAIALAQPKPNELIVTTRNATIPLSIEPGATISAYGLEDFIFRGSSQVVSVTKVEDPENYAIPDFHPVSWMGKKKGIIPWRLHLETNLDPVQPGAHIFSDQYGGKGYRIEGCYFRNGWAHAMRASGEDGTITQNTFDYTGGLELSIESNWTLGVPIQNLHITENHFRGGQVGRGAKAPIKITAEPLTELPLEIHHDILIEDNLIENPPLAAMLLTNIADLLVRNNTMIGSNQVQQKRSDSHSPDLYMNAAIVLLNCPDARLIDNQFLNPGPFSEENIKSTTSSKP